MSKANEALLTYNSELKRLKKQLLVAVGQSEADESDNHKEKNSNIDAIVKKFMKFKEDNKKLKSILK